MLSELVELYSDIKEVKNKKEASIGSGDILESRIKEINDKMEPLKKILIQTSTETQKIIQKIEKLEEKKRSVIRGVQLLKERYSGGKLPSKAAYEHLLEELSKKISSLQKEIDRYSNDLKTFAQ